MRSPPATGLTARSAALLSIATRPPVNDLWLHVDLFYDDFSTASTGDGAIWSIAVPGAEIAVIDFTDGNRALDYNNGTGLTATGTLVGGVFGDAHRFES